MVKALMSLIQQEEPLRPLFLQIGQVNVNFISRDGKEQKEQKELKFKVS